MDMVATWTARCCALTLLLSLAVPARAQTVEGFDPHVHATATVSPPRIALQWKAMANASGFTISRRAGGTGAWTAVGMGLPGSATSWDDSAVEVGKSYEYKVARSGSDGTQGAAYIVAGIQVPFPDDVGAVVLLVDKGSITGLGANLTRLEGDLRAEGWTVVREEVDAAAKPPDVRARLQAARTKFGPRLKAALLLGQVPQPYSGHLNPDGHAQHLGAWPADTYYADLDGTWTDTMELGGPDSGVLEPPKGRPVPMINRAGDGKFDQSTIPSDLDIAVGRIDARDMPGYAPLTAVDLENRYLDHEHAFRIGQEKLTSRSSVTDLLHVFNGDPLARMAWRDGTAVFGAEPTQVGAGSAFFSALESQGGYGLSFAISYGHVDGSDAIGYDQPFRNRKARTFFLGAFGSFFGDWSTTNNLLRDAIFHPGLILGANWCDWPNNHYHQLGALWTIGDTLRVSFNNDYGDQSRGARGIHSGIMGDPTLRLFVTAPPTGLAVARADKGTMITWKASPDAVMGYHVYRTAAGAMAAPERLTREPVTATSFVDEHAQAGAGYDYRVVAVKLTTTGSGTFLDHSAGAVATTDGPPPVGVDGGASAGAGGSGHAGEPAGGSGGGAGSMGSGAGGGGRAGGGGASVTAGMSGGAGRAGSGGEEPPADAGGCACHVNSRSGRGVPGAVFVAVATLLLRRRRGRCSRRADRRP